MICHYEGGAIDCQERDLDGDGAIDFRVRFDLGRMGRRSYEKLLGGKWQDTFEMAGDPDRPGARAWYVKGLLSKVAWQDPSTGRLRQRETCRDGFLSLREEDTDRDGELDFRSTYEPPDSVYPVRVEALRDGRWTGDFVRLTEHSRAVYKGGKPVRFESGGDRDGDGNLDYLYNYTATEGIEGRNGKITRWHRYQIDKRTGVRRHVSEARDLDGDGKPDLLIDYEKMTIRRVEPRAGQ